MENSAGGTGRRPVFEHTGNILLGFPGIFGKNFAQGVSLRSSSHSGGAESTVMWAGKFKTTQLILTVWLNLDRTTTCV